MVHSIIYSSHLVKQTIKARCNLPTDIITLKEYQLTRHITNYYRNEINMQTFIVFSVLIACVLAAPVDDSQTKILKYENDNSGLDGYKFA